MNFLKLNKLNNKIYKVLLIQSLFLLYFIANVFSSYGIDEKLLMEKNMASTMEEIIRKMTGDKNVIVIVNIEHNPEIQQEVLPSEQVAQPQPENRILFPGLEKLKKKQESFLPGIPLEKEQSSLNTFSSPNSVVSVTRMPSNFIKKIKVTVILSDTIGEEMVVRIKERLMELFPIDLARGDILEIKKMAFKKDVKEEVMFWKDVVGMQLPWILGLIVLTLFLFGPMRSFLRNIIATMEVFRIRADTRIMAQTFNLEPGQQQNVPVLDAEGKPVDKLSNRETLQLPGYTGKHFTFVNPNNVENLIYLLKDEPTETIVLVLTYLSPDLVNRVLSEFDSDFRAKILSEMMVKKQYTQEEVVAVEERIKQRIEYLLGGIDNTISLLNTFDYETRAKILEDLQQQNPELAEKIYKMILPFETLYKLPKPMVQELVRVAGVRLMAAVIKVLSTEEQGNYILDSVSENAREMIKQEMAATPSNISLTRIIQIKQQIISIIADMEKKGMIAIERENGDVIKVTSLVASEEKKGG
jgi:flagellar motor switch protein FliG